VPGVGRSLQNRRILVYSFIAALIFLMGTLNLERMPALWWDEGWTLSVARNWVETGQYGRLLEGQPDSPGLSAAFPVVAPVALSFKLFGIGLWQGRLPGVVFTGFSLVLVFYLAGQIYGQEIALGTLFVLLLMTVAPWLHPILVGRQVLGEMPAIFYLLTGFAFFWLALRRSILFLLPATLFWGIALKSKAQVPPFFYFSLLVPLGISLIKRWWRQALVLVMGPAGAWLAGNWITRLQGIILAGHTIPGSPLNGLYAVTALVPNLGVRLNAVQSALAYACPALFGLVHAAWEAAGRLGSDNLDPSTSVVRLSLLALGAGWLGWYLALGMWWPRYLFPAVFIGSMFAAAFLYRLTGGYNWRATILEASAMILRRRISRGRLGALLACVLIGLTVPLTVMMSLISYLPRGEQPAIQVARYLDTHIPNDALIETYDSELLFLSHQKFHYPPDPVSVLLQRRAEIDPTLNVDYNPLDADPDYLVVGPFSQKWNLYDHVLASGEFRLMHQVPGYQIYARARP
jgi:hypothetical protein